MLLQHVFGALPLLSATTASPGDLPDYVRQYGIFPTLKEVHTR